MTAFSITTDDQTNLPAIAAEVVAASDEAMRSALAVIQPAVVKTTPKRSGDLQKSESAFQRGPFAGFVRAGMFYASFVRDGTTRTLASGRTLVRAPNPFVTRGVDASEAAAVAAYESTFDREMQHGR